MLNSVSNSNFLGLIVFKQLTVIIKQNLKDEKELDVFDGNNDFRVYGHRWRTE